MCTNFQAKQTTLTFLAQICPKMDIGLEIQKNNVGIRISIVKMPCVPIFRKTNNFDLFDQNLLKYGFWGQNFKNLNLDLESVSLRYCEHQFSDKTENFEFLGPNSPKTGFWCQNFKNLSLDSESASLRYYVCQFSDKMDNFEFWEPNLPKTGFWDQNFKNLNLDSESAPLRYYLIREKKTGFKLDQFEF